jgi:hypothetical protein
MADLREKADFSIRDTNPTGSNWMSVVLLPRAEPGQLAGLNYVFARGNRFRAELYVDVGDRDVNKAVFDRLFQQRAEIKAEVGSVLTWERLDSKRTSRIALYLHDASIEAAEERLQAIRDWAVDAMIRLENGLVDRAEKALKAVL